MTSREFLYNLTMELAWAENALRDIAGMVHQAHLQARVSGLPGEDTLNKLDHAVTKIVRGTLEAPKAAPDMDGSSNGTYGY